MIQPGQELRQDRLNLNHFRAVWEGDAEDRYGVLAVTGTLAMVLRALGLAATADAAHAMAADWWQERHRRN
jgi:hypothetical protein